MSTNAALMSSARTDWNTPEEVLLLVRGFAGDHGIGLDPCSNPTSIVHARTEWLEGGAVDSLSPRVSWAAHAQLGLVYVNPPYGKDIGKWLTRCRFAAADGVDVIALVPARTDTQWFHAAASGVQAICFWKGRLTFLGAPSPAPFPSALLYWGENRYRFASTFEHVGFMVMP